MDSVFEPSVVKATLKNLRNSPQGKTEFTQEWDKDVATRFTMWEKQVVKQEKAVSPRLKKQLEWEANVVAYVNALDKELSTHKKAVSAKPTLRADFPILGPRFLPPTYRHCHIRRSHTGLIPETGHLQPLHILHPLYYPNEGLDRCPRCLGINLNWKKGWTGGLPRRVHGVTQEERAYGRQVRCDDCEKLGETHCWAMTNEQFWEKFEHWQIPHGIPIFFHRSAVTRDLHNLIIELRPTSTSGGIEERIRQLHLLEYQKREREYLSAYINALQDLIDKNTIMFSATFPQFKAFELHDTFNSQGPWSSISNEMVSEVYLHFSSTTRKAESSDYLKTLTAVSVSLDGTFKSAKKAVVVDKDKQRKVMLKGGIMSIVNERNEIIAWRLCESQSPVEAADMLRGVAARCEVLGKPAPSIIVVDNCCQVRSHLKAAIPSAEVCNDIFHVIMRYLAVIANGSKNPHRLAVAKDLSDALLESKADCHKLSKYRGAEEQTTRLESVYRKWELKDVWTMAASRVHSDQMAHARKGCLTRTRQDIRSDGSRIEGSHKGWNGIQRAHPSGLVMFTHIASDFVLRRNIRTQFNDKTHPNPFLSSTNGSHHTRLANFTAHQVNVIVELIKRTASLKWVLPALRPILQVAATSEVFGIALSKSVDTYLKEVKTEDTEPTSTLLEIFDDEGIDCDVSASGERICYDDSLPANRTLTLPHDDIEMLDITDISSAGFCLEVPAYADSHTHLQSPSISLPSLTFSLGKRERDSTPNEELPKTKRFASSSSSTQGSLHTFLAATSSQARLSSLSSLAVEPPSSSTMPSTIFPTGRDSREHSSLDDLLSQLHPPSRTPSNKHLTRSEALFASTTGVLPEALRIQAGKEFFLFMDLRAEKMWVSYSMTPRRWLEATTIYNTKLKQLVDKGEVEGPFIRKTPHTLMDKLGEIEPKILHRIASGDYKSKRGSTSFWEKHCAAVVMIKQESSKNGNSDTAKSRKTAVCKRCKSIMYPGGTGSPENHKRQYCSDGVRQKSNIPWPQPAGIFQGGTHFYPITLLQNIRRMYERLCPSEGQDLAPAEADLSMEETALGMYLKESLCVRDSKAVFELPKDFAIPDSTPDYLLLVADDIQYLRVDCISE